MRFATIEGVRVVLFGVRVGMLGYIVSSQRQTDHWVEISNHTIIHQFCGQLDRFRTVWDWWAPSMTSVVMGRTSYYATLLETSVAEAYLACIGFK